MSVEFKPYQETTSEDQRRYIFGVTPLSTIQKYSGATSSSVDTSGGYIEVGGKKFYPGQLDFGGRIQKDILLSVVGDVLRIGGSNQVKFGDQLDTPFGLLRPIYSESVSSLDKDIGDPHYVNEAGELVYLNGELIHGRMDSYSDTIFGDIIRVQTSVLHKMFTCVNPDGEMLQVNGGEINLVGKTIDTNLGKGSLCRGRVVNFPQGGYFVDENMEVFKHMVSDVINSQNRSGERISKFRRSSRYGKDIYVDEDATQYPIKYFNDFGREKLDGCSFPEFVSTPYGIFWNTPKGVANSSGEILEMNGRKVGRLVLRDRIVGQYYVFYKDSESNTYDDCVYMKDFIGKDSY